MLNRRGLLIGLGSLLAAPAIVRAVNLMPVRSIERFDAAYQWEIHGQSVLGEEMFGVFKKAPPWDQIYDGALGWGKVGEIWLRNPKGHRLLWSKTEVDLRPKDYGHPEPGYTNSEWSELGERGIHDPTTGRRLAD